jgi:hypothetical protein
MTFPHNEPTLTNAFSERRMSPFTASLTSENDRTDVVVKSFDVFHDRVDRAFHSMNPSDVSSSKSLAFWRTSAVLAIRLPRGGKHNAEDEEEEDKEQEDSDKEERNDCDCLFGTKKETRKSIGKCDRLDRENEFDGDDMMAVGATEEDFMVVRKKRKRRVIPDHERFPEKYVKYSFDEPVVVGGGESGILEKKKRKKEKTDVDEVRDLGVPQDALARSADVEKTRRDVGEPRIIRGKKKKEGADVEKESRKRTKRVTRSLSIATTSIAAQDVEENGGG